MEHTFRVCILTEERTFDTTRNFTFIANFPGIQLGRSRAKGTSYMTTNSWAVVKGEARVKGTSYMDVDAYRRIPVRGYSRMKGTSYMEVSPRTRYGMYGTLQGESSSFGDCRVRSGDSAILLGKSESYASCIVRHGDSAILLGKSISLLNSQLTIYSSVTGSGLSETDAEAHGETLFAISIAQGYTSASVSGSYVNIPPPSIS